MAECRSCGAAIEWRKTTNTGRPAPFDAEPSENGNVRFHMGTATILNRADAEEARALGENLHVSHFATCPNAGEHRKKALR